MNAIKFKVLTEYRTPMVLDRADNFVAQIPYNENDLEKSNILITNAGEGRGEIPLSEFEIQGLKLGENQPFILRFDLDGETYKVLFSNAFSVVETNGRKALS